MRLFILFLLPFCAFAKEVEIKEGSFGNNGADKRALWAESAWFLGQRPVLWCFEGKNESIAGDFAESVRLWREYASELPLAEGEPAFTEEFLRVNCNANPDFKLVESPAMELERISYDPNLGWSRGELRINETGISMRKAVAALFGVGEVIGTLTARDARLGPIDQAKELVHSRGERVLKGKLLWPRETDAKVTVNETGAEIFMPEGEIHVEFGAPFRELNLGTRPEFRKYYRGQKFGHDPKGYIYYGRATFPDGQVESVLVQRNVKGAFELSLLNRSFRPLFRAESYVD